MIDERLTTAVSQSLEDAAFNRETLLELLGRVEAGSSGKFDAADAIAAIANDLVTGQDENPAHTLISSLREGINSAQCDPAAERFCAELKTRMEARHQGPLGGPEMDHVDVFTSEMLEWLEMPDFMVADFEPFHKLLTNYSYGGIFMNGGEGYDRLIESLPAGFELELLEEINELYHNPQDVTPRRLTALKTALAAIGAEAG